MSTSTKCVWHIFLLQQKASACNHSTSKFGQEWSAEASRPAGGQRGHSRSAIGQHPVVPSFGSRQFDRRAGWIFFRPGASPRFKRVGLKADSSDAAVPRVQTLAYRHVRLWRGYCSILQGFNPLHTCGFDGVAMLVWRKLQSSRLEGLGFSVQDLELVFSFNS